MCYLRFSAADNFGVRGLVTALDLHGLDSCKVRLNGKRFLITGYRAVRSDNFVGLPEFYQTPILLMALDSSQKSRIRAALYGQAIGDALGLGTEGLTREEITATYPDGYHHWSEMLIDQHTRRWRPGDYTDDTEQALELLDSLLENGQANARDAALRLYRWVAHGGRGVGASTHSVTTHPDFLRDPLGVSERFWVKTGRMAAANGGLMRSMSVPLFYASRTGQTESPEQVEETAALFCRLTHFDPRCVASAVSHSLALYTLLTRTDGTEDGAVLNPPSDREMHELILLATAAAMRYDKRAAEVITHAAKPDTTLELLNLDNAVEMGYTLKTLAASFWALTHLSTFEKTLLQIVNAGGDADTNGAVSGSLVATLTGLACIPELWIKKLNDRRELDERLKRLGAL